MSPDSNAERELFETWIAKVTFVYMGRDEEGLYVSPFTAVAWDAWQARALLSGSRTEKCAACGNEICECYMPAWNAAFNSGEKMP